MTAPTADEVIGAYLQRHAELLNDLESATHDTFRHVISHTVLITEVCMVTLKVLAAALTQVTHDLRDELERGRMRSHASLDESRRLIWQAGKDDQLLLQALTKLRELRQDAASATLRADIASGPVADALRAVMEIVMTSFVDILRRRERDVIATLTELAKLILHVTPIGLPVSALLAVVEHTERRGQVLASASAYLDKYDDYLRTCYLWAILAEHISQMYRGVETPQDPERALQQAADAIIARLEKILSKDAD